MERLEIGFKFDLSKWIRLFNYIVAIIPLLMACFLALVYISGGWGAMIEGHTPGFYFLKDITSENKYRWSGAVDYFNYADRCGYIKNTEIYRKSQIEETICQYPYLCYRLWYSIFTSASVF